MPCSMHTFLQSYLKAESKEERVGLLLKDGNIIELNNTSHSKAESFSVAPKDMIKYEEETVATWHTHPHGDPVLSGADYEGFLGWPDYLHLIVGSDETLGYVIDRGVVIYDEGQNHPAWRVAEVSSERV